MYKNVIFGGSGFLGSNLADEISKSKNKILIIDKKPKKVLKNFQKQINCDILNLEKYKNLISTNSDVYFFSDIADIGYSKIYPLETLENNVLKLIHILKFLIKKKIKNFYYASTIYVNNDLGSFYRASKQCAEIIISEFSKNYNFNYTFLRYGSVYGPQAQEWNGIKKFVKEAMMKGKITYKGNGKELREYIHVKDAAKLTYTAVKSKKYSNKSILISGQSSLSSNELFTTIFEILNKKKKVKFLNKVVEDHYGVTPYRYIPNQSKKIVPIDYIDIGQGIIEVIKEINDK